MDVVVEFNNVWKYVVKDVTLRLEGSGIYAFFGPNGSGKTTLLKLAAGMVSPEKGDVKVLGGNPFKNHEVRKYINFVGARPLTDLNESVYSYLRLYWLLTPKSARLKKVEDALEELGVGKYLNDKLYKLSEGQRRRVELAKLLIKKALVNLIDEPTESLDVEGKARVVEMLEKLSKESMVIVASHDLDLMSKLKPVMVLIENGVVKGVYNYDEALQHLVLGIVVEGVVRASTPKIFKELKQIEGVVELSYKIDVEDLLKKLGLNIPVSTASVSLLEVEDFEKVRNAFPNANVFTVSGIDVNYFFKAKLRNEESLAKFMEKLAEKTRILKISISKG